MNRGFLGILRAVAVTAVVAGTAGSFGLMLVAGRRSPRFLLVLFAIWVLAPFVALLWANKMSKRWSVMTRATLHSVMLVIALSSLAIYGDAVVRPPRSTPAYVWVVVPLGSWLLMAIAIPIAALISGRRSEP